MSDNKDHLGDLLNMSSRRAKGRTERKSKDESIEDGGLNPLDILNLPSDQRELVNWLSRHKQADIHQIQAGTGKEIGAIQTTLTALKKADYVHEAFINGKVYYRVVFRGKVKRTARGMPEHIWSRVDLDDSVFLQELPLFQGLPRELVKEVADQLEERRYQRNEIILWQGDVNENIYFIKNGLIGITRLSPRSQQIHVLAYRRQGDIFGEFTMFNDQRSTTATVTALSEANVLTMTHRNFAELLQRHSTTAMEVMRVLMQRWRETSDFDKSAGGGVDLCLVLGVGNNVGVAAVGSAIATGLAATNPGGVVYTEHPEQHHLPGLFQFDQQTAVHQHPGGFSIFAPQETFTLSASVRITMVLDQLIEEYSNIIICLPGRLDETVNNLLERANQIVLVSTPDHWDELLRLEEFLGKTIHLKSKSFARIATSASGETEQLANADFYLSDPDQLPALSKLTLASLPEPWQVMAKVTADHLKRRNEIKIYVPALTENDEGQLLSTEKLVEETVQFLQELCGDVTRKLVKEVWEANSETIRKEVVVVEGRMSQSDLFDHLQKVLTYAENMKHSLQYDTVAIEVNHSLVLV